jgi:RNA recognition motif. (a.k.a. RRM, RBD, or RNP domain)
MVKYAEDQNKKKDRRAQVLGGMQGMNMMDNMGMMEGLKQDHRDPYHFTRSRAPSNPYRGQQTSPMPMQSTHMPINNLNQIYHSSPPQSYPSSRGSKNAGSGLSSPQGAGGLDWYGQMSPMVYDNHMNSSHTQLHNQSMGYSTHHGIQPMMSEEPSNQRQNYNLIQGGQYQYSRGPSDGGRPQDNSVTLLIGYLPQHADVALLHDLCSPYGRILSAQIDIDNSNPSDESCSGRGRVQMAELSQAQYATQALNGAIIFEGGRPLQVTNLLHE